MKALNLKSIFVLFAVSLCAMSHAQINHVNNVWGNEIHLRAMNDTAKVFLDIPTRNVHRGVLVKVSDTTGEVAFASLEGLDSTKVDTAYTINDSTLRFCKGATCWDVPLNSGTLSSINGIVAGGDLSGTYPNPSVIWDSGFSSYDARYLQTIAWDSGYTTYDQRYLRVADSLNLSYRLDSLASKQYMDSSWTEPGAYTDTVRYLKGGNTYTAALVDHQQGRIAGLDVSWSGSGLTYDISAGIFRLLDGGRYTSDGGSVTSDAADPTNPRYDLIYIDNTGTPGIITGTPSSSPAIPQVTDPSTQLALTSIFIGAGATTPSITQTLVWDENVEWTATNTAGITVNYANTSPVVHGSKSIDVGSWSTSKNINFTNGSLVNASDQSLLKIPIRLKTRLGSSTGNIRVALLNGTTVVSNVLTLGTGNGFSKINTTTFQNVTIPMSAFTFSGSTLFNQIRISLAGTGGGLYMDYVQLQAGVTSSFTETDAVALGKTVTVAGGSDINFPSSTQSLNSNPSFSLGNVTGLRGSALPSLSTGLLKYNGSAWTFDNSSYLTNITGLVTQGSNVTVSGSGTTGSPYVVSASGGSMDTVNVSNVLSYGADSTGATDATAAFNNAINAAIIGGKMRVYVPHGTYKISVTYLKSGGTATNNRGIELRDNIELFGDGKGKTILTVGNNSTISTSLNYIFPVINGYGVSNCYVHGIEISGNKTQQGQYSTNPYTNPIGYFADTSNRWSTNGVQFFYGDNNRVRDVYVHDCQGNGWMGLYTTNFFVGNSLFFRNGSSGTEAFKKCSGSLEYVIADSNASDQLRVDSCIAGINFSHCEGSNAQANASASNWFAGMYLAGCSNVHADQCYLHDNSAYGYDNPSDTTFKGNTITNSWIEYNGNAGIATANRLIIKNNWLKNNGKTRAGNTDTKSGSGYNPSAIALSTAADLIIEGNYAIDTVSGGNWAQTYFLKQTSNSLRGYYRSTISDNYIKGVADTAHIRNGNIGANNFLNNLSFTNANLPVTVAPDAYVWTYDGTYGNGKWAAPSGGGGSTALNSLTAATASNTINNSDFGQEWQWNSLTSNAVKLSTTSTAATGNGQTMLNIQMTGANATSTQTTYGMQVSNAHTGTSSTNIAGYFTASGGTNNYGLIVNAGSVGIGTTTPAYPIDTRTSVTSSQIHLSSSSSDAGAYITTNGAGNITMSGGAAYTGSAWVAKNTAAVIQGENSGDFTWYANGSLTAGNTFTPTLRYNVTQAGSAAYPTAGAALAIGLSSPSYKLDVRSNASASQAHFSNSSTDDGMYLTSVGAGNFILSGGAAYNGSSWIAKTTTAVIFGENSGAFTFYTNSGLTSGNTFTATERWRISTGATGGTLSNTGATGNAYIELKAGTATAGTAPIGFTAGTVLTSAVSGKLETNSTNDLFYTNSSATRAQIGMWGYVSKSADYTATNGDYTIEVTATGKTITLPTAVGITGRIYTIKLTASGTGTVATTSSQTIDGSTTYSLSAQYKYITVQSNNANWIVIANN